MRWARSYALNTAGREQLNAGLSALGLQCLPSAGNFVTARFADAQAAQAAHARLLASGISVSTLEPYDMADSLRISVGLPEHNRAVLDALA